MSGWFSKNMQVNGEYETAAIASSSGSATPAAGRGSVPVFTSRIARRTPQDRITTSNEAKEILQGRGEGVLFMNSKNMPTAWVSMSAKDMGKLRKGSVDSGAGLLMRTAAQSGATSVIVSVDNMHGMDNARNLANFSKEYGVAAVDIVVTGEGLSGYSLADNSLNLTTMQAWKSRNSTKAWPVDFPKAFAHTSISKVTQHPDFKAAKAGDPEAAIRLVDDLVKPERIASLAKQYPNAVVIPVVELEETGVNKIPWAISEKLRNAGLRVDEGVYQVSDVVRKDMGATDRLKARKVFEGEILDNTDYILADDILTQGGTVHELRHHIVNNSTGSDAVAITALAFSAGSNILAIKDTTISSLQKRFGRGSLEKLLQQHNIAGTIEALTESEGRAILRFKSFDSLQVRLSKEGHAGVLSKVPQAQQALNRPSSITTIQAESELKTFLGKGFDNLVDAGKLEVVQSASGSPLYAKFSLTSTGEVNPGATLQQEAEDLDALSYAAYEAGDFDLAETLDVLLAASREALEEHQAQYLEDSGTDATAAAFPRLST